ncbi:hypothetical protein L1987_34281 [Smallanthus sonchifolius]|uniref:Uncharacterized protein n=1 Tax=Smallanthus sonchifolius TaxID=185202 RepID=A0ACB9HUK4_9ASTR|nr:hypothetical protein L1987_34281 [Smallanthus sonchifolius]
MFLSNDDERRQYRLENEREIQSEHLYSTAYKLNHSISNSDIHTQQSTKTRPISVRNSSVEFKRRYFDFSLCTGVFCIEIIKLTFY